MKYLLTVVCSLLLLKVSAQQYDAIRASSVPIAGKKYALTYSAENAMLSAARAVSGKVYFYSESKPIGEQEFSMVKTKDGWKGDFKVVDSTVFLNLVFMDRDHQVSDNNHHKGYLLAVYNKGKAVPFAFSQMAGLLGGGPPDGSGIKKDQKQALIFMKEEIKLYPEHEMKLKATFYNMLANSPEREDKAELVKRLTALKSDQEADLMMAQLYLSYFGGKRQADSLDRLLRTRFPDGNYVKERKRMADIEASGPTSEDHVAVVKNRQADKASILKRVEEELVNEPTSQVVLKDLNGKSINLGGAELKGKVIVLDFWATWCKPCIASFPAIEKVMGHYRDNDRVKFFFISTMEQGDAVKNVTAFMKKNTYSFTVLLDEKMEDMNLYKAYSGYKATGGIPYKLVIDGNGTIRARASGFSGNDEELIIELSAMIDAALKTTP